MPTALSLVSRLFLSLLFCCAVMAEANGESVAYVRIEQSKGVVTYAVNGTVCKAVPTGTPYGEIMERLAPALKQGGKGQSVAIILGPDVGLQVAESISQVAQKVGFEFVLLFAENETHTRIRPLTLGSSIAAPKNSDPELALPQ